MSRQGNETLKPESWAWHLMGLINPILVILCNLKGDWWVFGGIVFVLGVGPFLDLALGKARTPKPPRASGLPFEILLYVHAALQFIALAALFYRAGIDGNTWTSWIAALSTGLTSGVSGIIVAHELGHKRPGSSGWWISRLNLLSVLYLHFTTEHNYTHHKLVATSEDPATAFFDESLWAFILRTIPGQYLDAISIHERKGKKALKNPVIQGSIIQVTLLVMINIFFGSEVLGAFLLQAGFAIFLLEYINYIRHYGLKRELDERQTESHSWQAEERWSRWTLLELTRHPAHHLKASEPFWKLQPFESAPQLPTGYYGCFWLGVIPPLWKKIMHPRIVKDF